MPSPLLRPLTPATEAYQQEQQAMAPVNQQAAEMDTIAQAQASEQAFAKQVKGQAAEAERVQRKQIAEQKAQESRQKEMLANAKRAGVKTTFDGGGQEQPVLHPDGQPVFEHGFQGDVQPGDNGHTVDYRDPRGRVYKVPTKAIRSSQDPAGNPLYEFDIKKEDGATDTIRQPVGSKPLWNTDPKTGKMYTGAADPETGSYGQTEIGVDTTVAGKAAIARQKELFDQQQAERKFQSESLMLDQNVRETNLAPVKKQLSEAQAAAKKLEKSKLKYRDDPEKGLMAVQDWGNGQVGETKIDPATNPDDIIKAKAWIEQKTATDKALADAKAAHDPLAAEVQTMQQKRDQLAIEALNHSRSAQVQMMQMEKAQKAGLPVHEPDWQKRIAAARTDPRITSIFSQAELDQMGGPLAEDAKRISLPETTKLLTRAFTPDFNLDGTLTEDPTSAPAVPMQRPEASLANHISDRLAVGNVAQKSAYGYPIKSAKELGLDDYFKKHPEVAGMAWGGGENDSGKDEPRVIVPNEYNKYMSDPVKREGLAKIEAARHKMTEVGYNPSFAITPEQQQWRKGLGAYAQNDKAFKQSIVSRLLAHDDVPGVTAQQQSDAQEFERKYLPSTSATDVKSLTTRALGITNPEQWQVSPSQGISGELGYHTLTHNGEDIGEFSTRENRFVLNPPSSGDMDRQQQRLINTSSDGLPVYFASATPPLPKAAVSDMIRQGVDISRSSTDRAAVESKLAEAKLSPADLRQKVMNGELSVQDGRLLNETFHGIKDVDASKPAIEAAFGQHLASPVLGPLFKKGDLTTRQGIVNQFMDAYAERAGSNIIAPNRSELAKLRSELLAKADPRGTTGKGVDFALDLPKNIIAPLAGMIVEAVSVPLWYGPRKLLGYKDEAFNVMYNGSRDLIQRQANTANFAHRLFGQGEMKDILGELKTSSDKIQSVDELPDEVAHKLRDAAYDGYHRFTDENAKDVNTTRDNYDIKKDPTLRAMFDRYLKTADGGTFDSMLQMLSMTANDRATQKQTMQYLERPQTATTDNVIERAKLLDMPLNEGKAAQVLTISKQLDSIKDEKQYKNLITQAGKVLGLEKPADVQMALSHLTREETDAPDSWRSLFRAGTVADAGEFATEIGSDILTGALTASIMGAPEAGMIKAAQVGARQGLKRAFMAPVTALRDGFSKVVGGSLDSLAEKSARFGSGRAMLAKTGGELADKYRKLGITTPKFGQPLTAIQKGKNVAVGLAKSAAAAAPIEATEEGVSALLQANPNKEDLVNSMVMGALGGTVLVPMFAGAQSLNRAWQSGKRNQSITDYKTGLVDKFNTRMAGQAGFTPLTVADFDIMQGIQDNPAHQSALQDHAAALEELGAATQEHTQNVMDYQDAAAGNAVPAIPDSPRLLTAQANAQRTAANVEGLSSMAFSAMDELRALPDDQRPLYTGIAKAVSGATDYTEAEGKALIGLGGQSAVAFQQAQSLPADVAGPANVTQLPGAPTVQQTGLGSYRLPAGVRIQVPPQAIAALQERAPSLTGLIGGTQQNAAPVQNGSKAPNTAQSTSSTGQNGPQGTNTQAQAADPVAALQANGGAVVHVADHKAAEALAGRTVQKGRRAFTQRIAGKPTVVIIDSEVASQKSRGGEAEMLAEEVAHAQTMLDEDANPDLAQAADDSMADSSPDFDPKLDAFMRANYNGYHKLSNRQKRYEAVAKIVSGKYTGQVTGGPLMAILKAILDLILKRNPSGTNAALNKIAANVSRALGQKAPVAQSSTQAASPSRNPALAGVSDAALAERHARAVEYANRPGMPGAEQWAKDAAVMAQEIEARKTPNPASFIPESEGGTGKPLPPKAIYDDKTPVTEQEVRAVVDAVVAEEIYARNNRAGRALIVTQSYKANDGGALFHIESNKVVVDPERLASEIWNNKSAAPTRYEVARAAELVIDHEVVHAAQIQAARDTYDKANPNAKAKDNHKAFMAWVADHYGQMWKYDFPDDIKSAVIETYGKVLEGKPEWQKAFEALRMIVQERSMKGASESATFLRIREHLEAVLAVLKKWYEGVMKGGEKHIAIKAEIEAIESLLANNSQANTPAINTTNTNENQTGSEKGNGQGRQGEQGQRQDVLTGSAASPTNTGGEAASLNFNVPLTKRGQVRQSVFPDAESLAAFQFKLDIDTAASAKSTPEESAAAKQRGIALLAKMMEDSPHLLRPELEKKLLEYHADVVAQAEGTSALDTFTPPAFHAYAKTDELASKSLPPPAGGDIISGMQGQGIRRIGPPVDSADWSWYRELEADAANSKLKPGEAQRLARAGDVTDARARLAWINANVVSAKSGRPIDEAAAELNASADQSFPVETGDELGRAIMEALDARAKAKQGGTTPETEREQQAKDAAASFDTLKAGAEGQPFTASQLSKSLSVNDELKIGPEYFHVVEVDPIDEYVRMENDRFKAVEITGNDTVNLTEGANGAPIESLSHPPVTHTLPDGYKLTKEGLNTIGSAPTRAYHGTPHKVDKFSMSKVGTGEGAQAYGYGLYFAQSEAVGAEYRDKLAQWSLLTSDGKIYNDRRELKNLNVRAALNKNGSIDDAITRAKSVIGSIPGTQGAEFALADIATLEKLKVNGGLTKTTGNLYTVDLLPSEDEFLDWDLPLSEQSEKVKAAFADSIQKRREWMEPRKAIYTSSIDDQIAAATGADAYEWLASAAQLNSAKRASERILSLGIPGIRYSDGQSRVSPLEIDAAKKSIESWRGKDANQFRYAEQHLASLEKKQREGTRNYVIFDENLVRIIAENGNPVDSLASAPSLGGLSEADAQYFGPLYFGNRTEGQQIDNIGDSIFLTDNLDAAKDYAHSNNSPQAFYITGEVASVDDLDIDWSASRWNEYHLEGESGTDDLDLGALLANKNHRRTIAHQLRKQGFTALKFSGDVSSYGQIEHDSWLVADSKKIKPAEVNPESSRDESGNISSAPSRYQSPTSMLAATQAQMQGAEGTKPAGLNSMFNPKPRIPATGERTLFQMPNKPAPAIAPRSIIDAYRSAAVGQSSAMIPIRSVFEKARESQPNLTVEDFLSALDSMNDGRALFGLTETTAAYNAAKPFVHGPAGVEMAFSPELVKASTILSNLDRVKTVRPLLPDEQAAYDKATADIAAQDTLGSAPSVAKKLTEWANQDVDDSVRTIRFENPNTGEMESFGDLEAEIKRGITEQQAIDTVRWLQSVQSQSQDFHDVLSDVLWMTGLSTPNQSLGSAPSRVTPDQDAEYMAAVESGDVAKQQAMVDAAAKDAVERLADSKYKGGSAWLTPGGKWINVNAHGHHTAVPGKSSQLGWIDTSKAMAALGFHRVAVHDGSMFVTGYTLTASLAREAKNSAIENGLEFKDETASFFNGVARSNVKTAKPVAEDNAGNVIPLSQRFNDQSDSILYSAPTESAPAQATPDNDTQVREIIASMPQVWQDVLKDFNAGKSVEDIAKDRLYTTEHALSVLSLAQGRFDYLRGALPTKPKVAPVKGGDPLFKGGRPDLAYSSIPAFAAVDQNRGTPEQVTHAEMQEAATRMFAIDPAAAEKLVTRWMDGGGMAFSVEDMPDGIKAIVADAQSRKASMALMTAAAQIFTVENAFAGGSSAKSARLIDLYRNSGEEISRALSQRRDVFETPAERNAWFLSEVLLTPPPSIRSEMKRNPANKAKILADWAARADQIKKELLAEGIDIDATMKQMAKERELAAATIPEAIKPALAQAPKSVRQAVKTILEGGSWQDAINASGLGHKAAQKSYNAFRGLRNIGAKIAAGIRDTLGSAPSETFTELPEWTDDVNLKSAPINTPQTKALAIHRNRKMEGEIDLKNDLSVNKTRQAMALRKASGFDKLMEYWKSSILSGPLSAIVNVSSGLGFGAYRVLFKKLSASVQADIIRLFGFQPDAPSLRDFPAMLSAVIPSLQSAGTDMLRSWNNETQFFDRFATDDGLFAGTSSDGEQFDPAIKGIFGKVMRGISFRHMTAADEFVKSFLTRIEVGAQALQIARNEGKTGEALATAMKDLMRPGSLAWERALSGAKVATFQSQEVRGNKLDSDIGSGERAIDVLDNLARILGKAKKGDFGSTVKVASHFLFPFVGTPTNIFKTGITMSPAGGLLALIDASRAVARSRKGNHQEAAKIYNAARAFDDITNQIVCWGVMLGIASLVKPGDDGEPPMITGSTEGDASSGERELTYRAAPPYSIRLWGKWYSYKRLDPLGTALAFCVDSVREFQKGKPIDKVWAKIGTGMLATMQDKTFMKSISDISNVLHDPERYGTQWIAGIATGFVPNLIRQPARATDHVVRETDFPNDMPFAESFARRIGFGMYPSPSNPLAPLPAVDAFGRESAKNTGTGQPGTDIMLRLISPLESLDATNVDPLDKKFLRYNMTHDKGFSFTAPPREITRTIDGKEIKISLSDEEYLPYEKSSGQAFYGAMNTIYGSKTADYSEQDHDDIVHLRTKVIKPFTDEAFSKALRKRQTDGTLKP